MATPKSASDLDPVSLALVNAPADDEPESAEERAAVDEAKAEARRGEAIRDDDLEHELGWE
jgi:hypothetical protein